MFLSWLFLNVLAPTFGKLLLTFFWMDESIWIVCLLTLTFWLVQLQLSSILNKEAIIIIIIIINIIIIIIIILLLLLWKTLL